MELLILVAALLGPEPRMSTPGEPILEETFETSGINDRWWFRYDWTIVDGVLHRNELGSAETSRIFLRNPKYRDVAIRFDFSFRGTEEFRLMTGSYGNYNAVVTVRLDHFIVKTGINREERLYPGNLGECAIAFEEGRWYTMVVEIVGDQLLAAIDGEHYVVGSHPILDRERSYFAFQVDPGGAAFDNVEIRKATLRDDWAARRGPMEAAQEKRPRVERAPEEQYTIARAKAHDRLYRGDEEYRALVDRALEVEAEVTARYPDVFVNTKGAKKQALEEMKRRLESDAAFRTRVDAARKAKSAVKKYVQELQPGWKEIPRDRLEVKLEKLRRDAEVSDPEYKKLVATLAELEAGLERDHPEFFRVEETVSESRKAARSERNKDPEFKMALKEVAAAKKAAEACLHRKVPALRDLARAAGKTVSE